MIDPVKGGGGVEIKNMKWGGENVKLKELKIFFNFFPLLARKKETRRGKQIKICSRGKYKSCAEYTPLFKIN